jgi:hypothetical protein
MFMVDVQTLFYKGQPVIMRLFVTGTWQAVQALVWKKS